MPYENLEYHLTSFPQPGVLHVRINRPDKLNAMHQPAWREYGRIFSEAHSDPEVRAVVLSGEGRALCAGLDVVGSIPDMQKTAEFEEARGGIYMAEHIKDFQAQIGRPWWIGKPVIAAIHGPCVGLGIDIVSAVDVRYASRDALMSVREIQIGMAADIGSLQRLPLIVGSQGWIRDLSFTGRNFDAAEAQEQGLVQRVFDTKEDAVNAAIAWAADVAVKSPPAVYGTKKALNYALDHTLAESLDQIAEYNAFALKEDFTNGAMAFRSKEKPKYEPLPALPRPNKL